MRQRFFPSRIQVCNEGPRALFHPCRVAPGRRPPLSRLIAGCLQGQASARRKRKRRRQSAPLHRFAVNRQPKAAGRPRSTPATLAMGSTQRWPILRSFVIPPSKPATSASNYTDCIVFVRQIKDGASSGISRSSNATPFSKLVRHALPRLSRSVQASIKSSG